MVSSTAVRRCTVPGGKWKAAPGPITSLFSIRSPGALKLGGSTVGDISDGLSKTIAIMEDVGRSETLYVADLDSFDRAMGVANMTADSKLAVNGTLLIAAVLLARAGKKLNLRAGATSEA